MWLVVTKARALLQKRPAINMSEIKISKRSFLRISLKTLPVIWGGIIIWMVKNYFTFRPKKNEIILGHYTDFQIDSITHNRNKRIFVIRDSQGLYVMSDICTHLGCRVQNENSKLFCPCHKTIFNLNGQPVEGPAKKTLSHYYIYKNKKDLLVVNMTQIVSNEFRYSL